MVNETMSIQRRSTTALHTQTYCVALTLLWINVGPAALDSAYYW